MNYKELTVWQRSVDLVQEVYTVTKLFPADERYCLIDQMRRAAISIPSNIAEGHSRKLKPDFSRFLRIAMSSCAELETQLIIANRLGYLDNNALSKLTEETEAMQKMLNKLISTLGN